MRLKVIPMSFSSQCWQPFCRHQHHREEVPVPDHQFRVPRFSSTLSAVLSTRIPPNRAIGGRGLSLESPELEITSSDNYDPATTLKWQQLSYSANKRHPTIARPLDMERISTFQIASFLPHDDVIKWKHFPRYWHFPNKGQWHRALMFSLICAWTNEWVNNRDAGDSRRHRAHYDIMLRSCRVVCNIMLLLQWRHNGHDGVSNHQPQHCLLNRLFRCRSKKTSKPRITGLCAGNSPVTGEFPAQMASNAENASIWWRHHYNKGDPVVLHNTSTQHDPIVWVGFNFLF